VVTVMNQASVVNIDTKCAMLPDQNSQPLSILVELNELFSVYSNMLRRGENVEGGATEIPQNGEGIHVTETLENMYITVETAAESLDQLSVNILNGTLVVFGVGTRSKKEHSDRDGSPSDQSIAPFCRWVTLEKSVDARGIRVSSKERSLFIVVPKIGTEQTDDTNTHRQIDSQ
jgi:hypothetical protein